MNRRTPMKRTRLKSGKPPKRKTPMRKINRARIKKLRAAQFGTDGYREEILSTPCLVKRTLPVDPAHVLGTRAAGHGPEGLAPLSREVHTAFDSSMTDERFEARYGIGRDDIRAWARQRRKAWDEGRCWSQTGLDR